ncbi:MAG: gamma-glutamylcyclotransferase family protein [Phycisphaeraceae bacterium]
MVYVFGYGSLLSPRSANRTLRRPARPTDLQAVTLRGYRRVWNVVTRRQLDDTGEPINAIVLGIEPAPDVAMVGAIFPVNDEELARLDQRERHYDRMDVTDRISPAPAGRVLTYLPKPAAIQPPDEAVVAQSYLDEIAAGCELLGEAFTRRYHETTVPHAWPIHAGRMRQGAPARP